MNQMEVKRRQIHAVSVIIFLITLTVVTRLTGFNGAAYIAAAAEACAMVWLAVSGSLSDVLGRLIRIRNSKGQYKNAERLRRNTLLFQTVLGLFGSLILLLGADWLARSVFRVTYSTFIIAALAPAVFLRTVSAVLLGSFQGEGSELPTAAAGLFRQFSVLGLGLLFGRLFGAYGEKVSKLLVQENFTSMYGGVGVAVAVSVTELLVVLFLTLAYRRKRRSRDKTWQEGMRTVDSFADSIRALCAARGQQWVTGLLAFLPLPLGLIFLQKQAEGEAALMEYGAYVACYLVICGCWTALIMMSLIPVCARTAVTLRKEARQARSVFQSGVHIGIVHAAFASVFLTVMADQFAGAVGAGQEQLAAGMLRTGGATVLFLALSLYFGRLLILTGGKLYVLGAVGAADIVYVVAMSVLLNVRNMKVMALVYAGLLGLGVLCIMLGALAYRQLKARPDWLQVIVIPIGAAAVTGLVCMLLGRVLTPHVGEAVALAILFLLGFALYWVLLVLLRNFREQELESIPGGRQIRLLGQLLRVF